MKFCVQDECPEPHICRPCQFCLSWRVVVVQVWTPIVVLSGASGRSCFVYFPDSSHSSSNPILLSQNLQPEPQTSHSDYSISLATPTERCIALVFISAPL